MEKRRVKLIFEDGGEFFARSASKKSDKVYMAVFCNDMVGYENLIFDPRSYEKLIVMSYPAIGNSGTNKKLMGRPAFLGALAAREFANETDPFKDTLRLQDALGSLGVAAVEALDTRAIVKKLRDKGSMRVIIAGENESYADVKQKIESFAFDMRPSIDCANKETRKFSAPGDALSVAAIDLGLDHDMIKTLWNMGVSVKVFPPETAEKEINAGSFDALLISDGPGCGEEILDGLKGLCDVPVFALGAGALGLARALGAKTKEKKRAAMSVNRPVFDEAEKRTFIASKFTGIEIEKESLINTLFKSRMAGVIDGETDGIMSLNGKKIALFCIPQKEELAKKLKDFIATVNGEKIDA